MTQQHLRRLGGATLATAVAALSACTDAAPPTAVAAAPTAAAVQQEHPGGIVHEMAVLPAFDLELRASGSMQPGRPIEVHLRVRANLPVADAEVKIGTPDAELPLTGSLDPRFSAAVGLKVESRHERRGGWQKGQVSTENLRFTVPAPGYYRVIASVFSRSELPRFLDDTLRVVPDVHTEIWVRVDRRGGRYTARFDTLAFPAEAERRAGPLHCIVDLDEERRGKRRDPGCDGAVITAFDSHGIATSAPAGASAQLAPGDFEICPMDAVSCGGGGWGGGEPYPPSPPPSPMDPCSGTHLCIQFRYQNQGETGWPRAPAPEGMLVEASYQDRDCALVCWWTEQRSVFYRADVQGRVIIPCPANSTSKRLRTAYEFLDEFVAVSRSEWDGPTVQGPCPIGWRNVDMVPNQEAFVYGNMRTSAKRAKQLFWWSSERTRVDFDNSILKARASWYDAPRNVINILGVDIWGDEGAATQAHEYGHSYHHKALGGIGHIYVSSVNPMHSFDANSNGAKALLEGFATFFETLVMPGKGWSHRYVRHPEGYHPTLPTGSRSEARVSAFFWDYIDDAAEKGWSGEELHWDYNFAYIMSTLPAEPFDNVQFPHTDLAHVLIWCRTGAFQTRPESLEGLMECFRARTNAAGQASLNQLYSRTVDGIIG